MEEKTKERLHKIFGYILVIIAVALVVGVFGGAYYFIIAPNMVSKPLIENPGFGDDALELIQAGNNVVTAEHLNYLANEISAYKLHTELGSDSYPIIEFVLTDTDDVFYAYVKDNVPETKKGNAKNEDIVLKAGQEIVYNILESDDIIGAVREYNSAGEIQIELVADMKTLAKKGYLSLYDTIK
jgi:uncharacterized protein YneF (UPF0154 family)